MKIAYIVLAHRYPEQLIRLIDRLSTDKTFFFVHIDKKTDEKVYRQIVNDLNQVPNAYFLKRYHCYWGDFSIVAATVEGVKEIFKRDISFDWLILLSGQDYPIKSNDHIVKFLYENQGKSFIDYFPLPRPENLPTQWPDGGFARIKYWHFRLFNWRFVFPGKLWLNTYNYSRAKHDVTFHFVAKIWFALVFWLPIKRNFPKGFKPFAGSQFWCLSRDCAEYVHNFIQENSAFVDFFKYTDVPDEFFFQTIVLNSSFNDSVINSSLRYMDWQNPNPDIPAILGKEDFNKLLESSELFARKFDITRDADILKMIDQNMLRINVDVELPVISTKN